MENLGLEHFFPGIPSVEKRYLESGVQWLLPEEISTSNKKRTLGWQFQDGIVSNEEALKFGSQKAKYPDDIQGQVVPKPIEKGKFFGIRSLLSLKLKDKDGNPSNYLVRGTSNDDRVDIETLRNKFIMLCCFSVPAYRHGWAYANLQSIALASHELSRKHKSEFEMVVVVKMKEHWADDKVAFDHFVSAFSCLVVPFDHPFRRDYICKSLNFDGANKGLLVDCNQIVVQDNISFLRCCGIYAFPFTDERLSSYYTQTWKGKSLEELLGCTPSDYLYKNCSEPGVEQPEKVSISELKEKLVGLYLCVTGSYIAMLEKAYQHSQDREHGFEIVLVYMPFYAGTPPEVFQEVINQVLEKRKISWWVLPFAYSLCCRLSRWCGSCISDQLIIVSPGDELVDPRGGLVIKNFGINTYPFTREALVKEVFKMLEQHSLESLLEGGFLSRRNNDDGAKVCVSDLQGRNVLLYLSLTKHLSFGELLTSVYNEIKAKDPDFEVVFVCLDDLDIQKLPSPPGLVFHPNPSKSKIVFKELFISKFISERLVAFDKDGQICSINAQHLLRSHGSGAFPFSGDLLYGILAELDTICDGEFGFQMVWSNSFKMDKRMTSSPYRAKLLSLKRRNMLQ